MAEIVYPPVIALARGLFRVLGLRITVTGADHLPATGGGVVVLNHVSYVDFVFAGLAGQQRRPRRLVRFMAKEAVFRHRVAGPLMRNMKHISVDREAGAAAYATAVAALRGGELVGVNAEATISRSFQLKDFKTGAARMAIEAGVPLIPVVIWGSQRLLTKGRPRKLVRRIPLSITVGEPMRPDAAADPVVVTKELRETMAGMLDAAQRCYPDSPAGPDDRWWLPVAMGGTAPTPEEAAAMDAAEVAERRRRRAQRP